MIVNFTQDLARCFAPWKAILYEKTFDAWNNLDVDAYWACLHDDWQMTWHSTVRSEVVVRVWAWRALGYKKHTLWCKAMQWHGRLNNCYS